MMMGIDEEAKKKWKKEEPIASEAYNSDEADISLVSSDNVLFRVHSYQLMAGS